VPFPSDIQYAAIGHNISDVLKNIKIISSKTIQQFNRNIHVGMILAVISLFHVCNIFDIVKGNNIIICFFQWKH